MAYFVSHLVVLITASDFQREKLWSLEESS